MDIVETHSISNDEYFELSLSNSDDNENSIHFIDTNHAFECIEEEDVSQEQPDQHQTNDHCATDHADDNETVADDDDDDDNVENYYTIDIEDDFDTDFEKDSLIA